MLVCQLHFSVHVFVLLATHTHDKCIDEDRHCSELHSVPN